MSSEVVCLVNDGSGGGDSGDDEGVMSVRKDGSSSSSSSDSACDCSKNSDNGNDDSGDRTGIDVAVVTLAAIVVDNGLVIIVMVGGSIYLPTENRKVPLAKSSGT